MSKAMRIVGILVGLGLLFHGFLLEAPYKRVSVSTSYYPNSGYVWSENTGAQYFNGDAYNYQIEATLKAGYLTSIYIEKYSLIVGGLLLFFISVYSLSTFLYRKEQIEQITAIISNNKKQADPSISTTTNDN